jgi:hypothetical protein
MNDRIYGASEFSGEFRGFGKTPPSPVLHLRVLSTIVAGDFEKRVSHGLIRII